MKLSVLISLIAMALVAKQVECDVTLIEYFGTIVCPLSYNFCAYGVYIEIDYISDDDHHAELPMRCATGKTLHHVVFNLTGDEDIGFFGVMRKYEPALELVHNCTDTGSVALVKIFRLEKVRIWEKSVKQNYTINIYNQGKYKKRKNYPLSKRLPEGTNEWIHGKSKNWNPKIEKYTGVDIAEYLPVPEPRTDYEMTKGLNGSSDWVPLLKENLSGY